MLGRLQMSISQCIQAYLEMSEEVFRPKRKALDLLGKTIDLVKVRGRFDSEQLKQSIQDIVVASGELSEAKLKKVSHPKCRV